MSNKNMIVLCISVCVHACMHECMDMSDKHCVCVCMRMCVCICCVQRSVILYLRCQSPLIKLKAEDTYTPTLGSFQTKVCVYFCAEKWVDTCKKSIPFTHTCTLQGDTTHLALKWLWSQNCLWFAIYTAVVHTHVMLTDLYQTHRCHIFRLVRFLPISRSKKTRDV